MRVIFEVQGSAEAPYRVTFENRGAGSLSAYCTCPAGEKGQYCKHRISILGGSVERIVSGNEPEVALVASWLKGSDVETKLNELNAAEKHLEAAKRAVSRAKQELARAFRD